MKNNRIAIIFALIVLAFLTTEAFASETSNDSNYICAVYFTGIGCPHCAKTDPFLFKEILKKNPKLIIIEYEIYQQNQWNADVFMQYSQNYSTEAGVPLILFGKNSYIIGDTPIIENLQSKLNNLSSNPCPLIDGQTISFERLDLAKLPGLAKIWHNDRIIVKQQENAKANNKLLKEFLLGGEKIANSKGKTSIPLSGREIEFKNSNSLDGWLIAWQSNGGTNTNANTNGNAQKTDKQNQQPEQSNLQQEKTKLTLPIVVGLAAVDAINPCALAVLTLMLLAIITYNPKNRRKVLFAGLAFSFTVYVIYLFYGLVLIKFFQLIQFITSVRLLLYEALGVFAIILAFLNIKDFISYKPGGFLTEMPLSLRPKLKKIIEGITSVKAAALIGAFVTLFLLPCTIGPYVITAGMLSTMELIATLPWLLLYNLIFISPMLAITCIVYYGFKKVEDISGWKDKNIRYLHLIAGLIMLAIGIAMLLMVF